MARVAGEMATLRFGGELQRLSSRRGLRDGDAYFTAATASNGEISAALNSMIC